MIVRYSAVEDEDFASPSDEDRVEPRPEIEVPRLLLVPLMAEFSDAKPPLTEEPSELTAPCNDAREP